MIDKKEIIKLFRSGLTQTEVAKRLGCSKQYISYFLKENNWRYIRAAQKLQDCLDIDIKQVLQYVATILMEGRTFYDGYFDQPFENLKRIDQATLILLNLIGEIKNGKRNNN